jgi:hypothetical protein
MLGPPKLRRLDVPVAASLGHMVAPSLAAWPQAGKAVPCLRNRNLAQASIKSSPLAAELLTARLFSTGWGVIETGFVTSAAPLLTTFGIEMRVLNPL